MSLCCRLLPFKRRMRRLRRLRYRLSRLRLLRRRRFILRCRLRPWRTAREIVLVELITQYNNRSPISQYFHDTRTINEGPSQPRSDKQPGFLCRG